mmetsp:Transcript_37281/g.78626  ORF Transcript_37281/g.78626 Transcript_37281/m.78626 type:complete len:1014 (+) Transcript_37281:227-3268(+)|eukprot:CAMPEP_0183734910 /NCGR_PEP_ID=MMETSP0737-20130205/45135_1 /TAXON_ID=385413 /ORGANISM="Thalassiosira miniscula, Strain CCMP1093" /LENGTH=1013 /DNA_ID=CAMNT_0025968527 /DNA_START=135 /DNA_END=3176 /DNA_ORIENTATION=+
MKLSCIGPFGSVSTPSASFGSFMFSILLSLSAAPTANAAELILYNSLEDGVRPDGISLINGRSLAGYCDDTPTSQYADDEYAGILQICTDPWSGGGLRLHNPDAWAYSHVTFLAKSSYGTGTPRFSMTCGWWPRYGSNAITLSGEYVAGGGLSPDEWRQVVIPTSDLLLGSDCDVQKETYSGFYSVNFLKWSPPPKYWVTDIRLTDDPPTFGSIGPTKSPTDAPTTSPTPYSPTVIWDTFVEDPNNSCLDARNNSTQVQSADGDYIQLITDPWKGSTLQIESFCFFPETSDPQRNDFTDEELALTFSLKATGDFGPTCDPVLSMAGGSWIGGVGWSGISNNIKIEHDIIDYGAISSEEYRQVSIPMNRFKEGTGWDLSSVRSISFHYCREMGSAGQQPKYYVKNIQVTKRPPELVTPYPTGAPTVRVTEDPSLATHRMIHHHWYPVLGEGLNGDTSTWLEAVNNEWPSIPAGAQDHDYTVHIPMGSVITYSGASSLKLDKVVVHGTLIIKPDDADVLLTCHTLCVEMMGMLTVQTEQNGHTVTIEIDGAMDTSADPEQTMLGLVNLGGMVTISGDPVVTKMATVSNNIAAGDTFFVVDDPSGEAANTWSVGDELVLPETKEGLDVDHWSYQHQVPGETETAVIAAIATVGSVLQITPQQPVVHDHTAGCHVAHTSRSITIKTSATSTDRGHVMHTGMGKFDVSNTRFEELGRTTTDAIDLTALEDTGMELAEGLARLNATYIGTNQIARYALHSHHSMIKVNWSGNAIINSPKNCMVMHNSFGDITDNIAVGCNGTAIFLESGTESGLVDNNFLVGTGGGTRGHDDGRFASAGGLDMAHGGFGIWARGLLAPITNNHAEGVFGRSPYAYFVHPLFISDNVVPMVEGTNPAIAGKTLHQIFYGNPVALQTYGPFVGNSAFGTWRSALDLSYFSKPGIGAGHIIEEYTFTALAYSGSGVFMVHSFSFDLVNGDFNAIHPDNTIIGEFCNNGDPPVVVYNNNTTFDGFAVIRGGNC